MILLRPCLVESNLKRLILPVIGIIGTGEKQGYALANGDHHRQTVPIWILIKKVDLIRHI